MTLTEVNSKQQQMLTAFTFNLASFHLIKPSVKSSNPSFLFHNEVEGWDGPGYNGRPVQVRGRVTVGLSKGTGVEVYCFAERSLSSCQVCIQAG